MFFAHFASIIWKLFKYTSIPIKIAINIYPLKLGKLSFREYNENKKPIGAKNTASKIILIILFFTKNFIALDIDNKIPLAAPKDKHAKKT